VGCAAASRIVEEMERKVRGQQRLLYQRRHCRRASAAGRRLPVAEARETTKPRRGSADHGLLGPKDAVMRTRHLQGLRGDTASRISSPGVVLRAGSRRCAAAHIIVHDSRGRPPHVLRTRHGVQPSE